MGEQAALRLQREFAELKKQKHAEFQATPYEKDIRLWNFEIKGPAGTPYEGGLFNGVIRFPNTYPFKPPQITFRSRMFHPNISSTGAVCMSILQSSPKRQENDYYWTPTLTIEKVLLSLCSLLNEPNPQSSLNHTAAQMWMTDREEYVRQVKVTVEESTKSGQNDTGTPARFLDDTLFD